MKKTIVVMIFMCLFLYSVQGQRGVPFLLRFIEKGDIYTAITVGPNRTAGLFAREAKESLFTGVKSTVYPVVGFKFESIRNSGFSLVFEGCFTYSTVDFTVIHPPYSSSYQVQNIQMRYLAGNNYHFRTERKARWYIGYLVGGHIGDANFINVGGDDISSYKLQNYKNTMNMKYQFLMSPITFRVHAGVNISVSDKMGVNIEAGGLGVSYVRAGAVIRLK